MNQIPNTEEKCCDKCYSTYTTDDYPDHQTLDACINRSCECHTSKGKTLCNGFGFELRYPNGLPDTTEIEEVVEEIGNLLQTGEYDKAVAYLHQQLQKAREEERERAVDYFFSSKAITSMFEEIGASRDKVLKAISNKL